MGGYTFSMNQKNKKCYLCKKQITQDELKEKAWYDGNNHFWHFTCGLKDERFTQ